MIRNFIEFAINKPILNHIFLLFLLVVSIISYRNIPKEIFPPSNLDAIMVTGNYMGASADILDKMAVKSIEDELKNLSEVGSIDTTIKSGFFNIQIDLKDGIEAEDTIDLVKDIISNIKRDLPSDMDEPTAKIMKHAFPLVTIAVAGEKSKEELLAVAEKLKSDLSSIRDLSEIVIRGDADEELVFFLNEAKIDAYHLNKTSVIEAIKRLSSIFPIGTIKERGSHLFLSTLNGEKDKNLIEDTIISINGKKVYIKDIARVNFQLSDSDQISHYNGKQNISISVNKSESGNAIALVRDIKKLLKEYEEEFSGFEFNTYTDTSIWIKNRLNTVVSNILFGLILVFLSMYFFINSRIAIVVAIGIPVSFMIGLIATYLMGYSLNMLSLLGGLIALGMLVDEAIVVAENIYRHMENGDDAQTACINGAVEMFPAVLTATATTVFAFLPLLIVSGEIGMFIKILPIMISILLISSLFEAFFFLPLHAKDFLKVHKSNDESMWKKLNGIYIAILSFMLRFKKISLILLVVGIIGSTLILAKASKFQLFPEFDTTQIYINGKVDVNSELTDTEEIITKLEKVLLAKTSKDDVSSITSIIGLKLDSKNQAEIADYYFHIFVNLHESAPDDFFNTYINPYLSPEYDASAMIRVNKASKIADELKVAIEPFQDTKTELGKMFQEINVIVPQTGILKSDIEISFAGDDKSLREAIDVVKEQMAKIDGVYNISDDLFEGEKELKFRVNEYGQKLGIDETIIFNSLKPFFLKGEQSKMFNDSGLIRVKLQSSDKDSIKTLNSFYIEVANKKVKLSEVVDFIYQPSFAKIIKEDGKRIRTLFASLKKKETTSAEFLEKIKPTLNEVGKSVEVIIKGEEKENSKIKQELSEAGIIALFLIFIALVWMFDSTIKALMVISTIPLAILGVLLGHIIMGINLTMPSLIGIVGLAGVIVNDGLIMVDFIKNASNLSEVIDRAKLRLRPIILTSLTTILGLATLIFFPTGQSLILQPMAITIGFGLIWATVLNLYYIPILFSVIYKKNNL